MSAWIDVRRSIWYGQTWVLLQEVITIKNRLQSKQFLILSQLLKRAAQQVHMMLETIDTESPALTVRYTVGTKKKSFVRSY